ncbi:hypothetical protein PC116_g31996 [Phytophthora cactorum]|nr:hypothetical protein PC116_g31996 [Phytophthora cactorum]
MVAHTAASKILSHSAANDWLQAGTEEMWSAATKTVEAFKKWPASQEPNETVSAPISSNGNKIT